jgi:subtilisin family serine protease
LKSQKIYLSFLIFAVPCFFFYSDNLKAQCLEKDAIPGQYIVRLKKTSDQTSPEITTSSSSSLKVHALSNLSAKNSSLVKKLLISRGVKYRHIFDESAELRKISVAENVEIPPTTLIINANTQRDVDALTSHPNVDSVEQDCYVHVESAVAVGIPNDPMYSQQWGLEQIHIREAWEITKGDKQILVGVSDTGIDYNHEDLKDNMWTNPKEIPGNGIDDDGNGCVDDIHGCDLAEKNGDPMPVANNQELSHGTHVAGIIAAKDGNNVGGAGVAPNITLLAAKGFPNLPTAAADESALLQTIYYSVNNGAKVINCSWGRMGGVTLAEIDAFKYANDHGVVVVVAAGNNNQDSTTFTPATLPSVITVAATDRNDQLGSFSNWGSKIDMAAPGGTFNSVGVETDGILSTLPMASGKYGEMVGTSMAAPFVSGVAALILSINPALTPSQVLKILQQGGDKIHVKNSNGASFDYSRLNAFGSLQIAKNTVSVTPPNPPGPPAPGSPGSGAPGPNANSDGGSPSTNVAPNLKSAFNGRTGCGLLETKRVDMSEIH